MLIAEASPRGAAMVAETLERHLRSALAAMATGPFAVAAAPIASEHGLFPEEAALVAGAVSSRRREFAAGRCCARRALALLGCPLRPLPMGAVREPLWPAGFAGSISHGERFAAALAHPAPTGLPRMAIDLIDRLDANAYLAILPAVAHPAESPRDGHAAARLFSAKEAAIKILSPALGTFVDMRDLEATRTDDGFDITARREGLALRVRTLEVQGIILSLAVRGSRRGPSTRGSAGKA